MKKLGEIVENNKKQIEMGRAFEFRKARKMKDLIWVEMYYFG